MRIALIHHQFQLKGGMETYLCDLVTGFNRENDQITTYVYKYAHDENLPQCQVEKKQLKWLPRSWRKFWFAYWLGKSFDPTQFDLSLSLMRSLKQDIIICGGTHKGFLNHINKRPKWTDKLEINFETKGYKYSRLIIAHSQLLKEELINLYGVPVEKIVMLHPPVDTTKFHFGYRDSRSSLREKFKIYNEKMAILFPSTGHKRKGFYLLLEAIEKLGEGYQLIVAGRKPPVQSSKVNYVGYVNNMAELYTACDMTVLPSFYEPFGLVVTESLCCGTPVIVSSFVGAKDLIKPSHGIILKELTSQAIVEALLEAQHKKFFIEEDFALKNKLSLSSHIQAIKDQRTILRK